MIKITSSKKTADQEKNIITNMIVSDEFINGIYKIYDSSFFSSFLAKTVSLWVIDYYKLYKKAPFLVIKDIYENKKKYLSDEQNELVFNFLYNLSNEFIPSEKINTLRTNFVNHYNTNLSGDYYSSTKGEQEFKFYLDQHIRRYLSAGSDYILVPIGTDGNLSGILNLEY